MTIDELTERVTFDAKNEAKDVFRETDLRARRLMSANSQLDYGAAVRAVFNEDRDLCELYVRTTPPLHHNGGA
ncbi:MAG TPA: hypothetical protein VF329_04280 [Gammaproteobacteria bacterium]